MIKKSVVLPCRPERAFALFTEHAGEWWPAGRRHTTDTASAICIEATGRFFERAHDGAEVELGVVQLFEPARRLVLDWYPGTGRTNPTQVDVRFEAVAEGTRVTVTHGPGAAGADLFGRNAAAYDRSWELVLTALASQGEVRFDIP
jgi:uncharacterized protein YndB with AHSA1/START domain